MSEKNVKSGQQGTDKPWERPGQSSQDPSLEPLRRRAEEAEGGRAPLVPDEKPYNAIPIPRAIDERPTEDDLAQAALGGPKGHPALPAAPLTKTEREQNSPNDDPGHVA